MAQETIRNIAIIAHVDHGKTTLVDKILNQTGSFRENQELGERVMDSNQLEKERGITILAKCTAVEYQGIRVNVVDTPGHRDFGGEVERVLNLVDAALLLVDAFEGPMPQTRFVTQKALEIGLKIILVVNKIDRPFVDVNKVVNQVFDLLVDLGATEEQLDFPIVYASAKQGYAMLAMEDEKKDLTPLLDTILKHTPPKPIEEGPFQMLVSDIQYDPYLGRLLLGRIKRGRVLSGENLCLIQRDGNKITKKSTKIFRYEGLNRVEKQAIEVTDIALIGGLEQGEIGETLCHPSLIEALPTLHIDLPTLSIFFRVNDSPFAGKEGKFCTSRQVRERLYNELLSNVALKVEDTDSSEVFKVSGRGELHLSILIETMRRQGYEFSVSRPEVIYKYEEGKKLEPIEELILEAPTEFLGGVMDELGQRKAEIKNITAEGSSMQRVTAIIPTRSLIGFRSLYMTLTRGEGIIYHSFLEYQGFKGDAPNRRHGVLIASALGDSSAYSMAKLQERGYFFIHPGTTVYPGMIVGACSRDNDLNVNVCIAKKLTNVRAAGKDDNIQLSPPVELSIEKALEFIESDELIEITPKSLRLRKLYLDENERKRQEKKGA